MTCWEKANLLLYLAEENLYEWLAYMITDKDFPLTLNAITFILDITRKLTMGSPKTTKLSVLVSAFYRRKFFSRREMAEFLSEVN